MSLLGPSVHTYRVIRPNYERKVRFPFMLLNESQPRPPRISQHQQGAGDLQIKHSDYLCPPLTAPPPITLLSITAHTKREGTHRTVVMIWGIKVFLFFVFPAELEGRVLHIPRLVLYHVIRRYPPELLNLWDCAIHKYKEQAGKDILITGVGLWDLL